MAPQKQIISEIIVKQLCLNHIHKYVLDILIASSEFSKLVCFLYEMDIFQFGDSMIGVDILKYRCREN